jgi:hypothetical protein
MSLRQHFGRDRGLALQGLALQSLALKDVQRGENEKPELWPQYRQRGGNICATVFYHDGYNIVWRNDVSAIVALQR